MTAGLPGLSVPVLTALDPAGRLDEPSQARLLAWVSQEQKGAEIIFSGGTTGEWNRLEPAQLRRLNEVCLASCRGPQAPALWAGVTALRLDETLKNLEAAHALGVAAAVLAPLSISDAPAPLELFKEHILPLYARLGGSRLPLCLYDNADIAAKEGAQHLRTRDVKALSRLDFVFGVKVSAGPRVVGNYLKGARHFKTAHEFGVYLGNANLMFSLFNPGQGLQGWMGRLWKRFTLGNEHPVGLVAGPANLFPREWRRAWQACVEGDLRLMRRYQNCFEALSAAWRFEENGRKVSKSLAALKAALAEEGILDSDSLAKGTPVLNADQRRDWLTRYQEIKMELAGFSPEGWTSLKQART
jgi:dihydrodipicolinate synthase/N-acetylneuraminate lyase